MANQDPQAPQKKPGLADLFGNWVKRSILSGDPIGEAKTIALDMHGKAVQAIEEADRKQQGVIDTAAEPVTTDDSDKAG